MSLREEIEGYIYGALAKVISPEEASDKILSKIEKRIDDEIWNQSKDYIESEKPTMKVYTYRGYMNGLKKVKEMLK